MVIASQTCQMMTETLWIVQMHESSLITKVTFHLCENIHRLFVEVYQG